MRCTFQEMTANELYFLTGFKGVQYLRRLYRQWRMPTTIQTKQGHCFSGEEVLIVCLARFTTGDNWQQLITTNDGVMELRAELSIIDNIPF
jgi:hypothetical protein